MDWTISIIFLVIGAIIGFVISQMKSREQQADPAIEAKLQQVQAELAQYRQEVSDHFANGASLMNQMATDYNKIYQHMVESQAILLPDESPQQLSFLNIESGQPAAEEPVIEGATEQGSLPPKDYVRGSHGIIKPTATKEAEAV